MTEIHTLAEFISGTTFAALSRETTDQVKMHILDTVGAMLAGAKTPEGAALAKLVDRFSPPRNMPVAGDSFRSIMLPTIIANCGATRCTEIDDIHLESCTTPGSVIVPTALALAKAGYLADPADFLLSVALGYELLIRLGMAVNGPEVLYQGTWPTYLAAALGSAAVAARALALNAQQAANALAMALTMSRGAGTRAKNGISSRWLILGIAAQNGVIAACAAQEGFVGDEAFIDKTCEQVHGLKVIHKHLSSDLGQQFLVDQTGIKPYPIGRQALSAVEAFRAILTNHRLEPESIQGVYVQVPRQFVSMIDHPQLPENRMDTIRSVQYQIALAAYKPDSLFDVQRANWMVDDRMRVLMDKIRIKSSEKLASYYPSLWPAQVRVRIGGKTYSCEMLHPKGDPDNRFQWDEVISKFTWVAKPALDETTIGAISKVVRNLEAAHSLPKLLELLA
ncbi:MAG: MmgE/PrpD family protein [Pseudomonadota bacterium]